MQKSFLLGAVLLAAAVIGGGSVNVLANSGSPGEGGGVSPEERASDGGAAPAPAIGAEAAPRDSGANDGPLVVASLERLSPVMPRFVASALPEPLTADVVRDYDAADTLRKSGDLTGATEEFMKLIESEPDTPQAKAADSRLDYMVLSLPEADLDEMESGLPPMERITTNFGKTVMAQFYFNRALRLVESDGPRAMGYITNARDLAWEIMQDELDDPFKSKILEGYLVAAEMTGSGREVRAQLSAYADTLKPCFTWWLIKAVVDGEEPPLDSASGFASRDAIRCHLIRMGKESKDPAESASYYGKARDLSRQMLEEQPPNEPALYLAGTYLEMATLLGGRAEAVADMEAFLASKPLSIMRWIVRHEMAMDYVASGRSEEETRQGFAHFEALIVEGSTGLIDSAINNAATDEGVRGLIMCMLGHAYFGTNRLEEARVHYEWVLDYYPKESHPGDSAEYSLAEVSARDVERDPREIASRFVSFVDENPSGSYSKLALMRAARVREASNDVGGARATYERIIHEYPNSSTAREAEASIPSSIRVK